MQVTAQLRHLHMSPRKVRRIAGLIKGMPVVRAQAELEVRGELAAAPLQKLLNSAIANAHALTDASPEHMLISALQVNEGPSSKRYRPRSRGMAHPLLRRTSHVSLVLTIPEGVKRLKKESAPPPTALPTESESQKKELAEDAGASVKESRVKRTEKRKRLRPKLPKIGAKFFQRKSV